MSYIKELGFICIVAEITYHQYPYRISLIDQNLTNLRFYKEVISFSNTASFFIFHCLDEEKRTVNS